MLTIHAGAGRLAWMRDSVDVYALHVEVPKGATSLALDYQFLSPVESAEGRVAMTDAMLDLQWNTVVLYPAGYFSRRIEIAPSVKLPAGWKFATALDSTAGSASFKTVPLNTLVDSPLIAGRNFERVDLGAPVPASVHLDIVADEPDDLAITPAELAAHRR